MTVTLVDPAGDSSRRRQMHTPIEILLVLAELRAEPLECPMRGAPVHGQAWHFANNSVTWMLLVLVMSSIQQGTTCSASTPPLQHAMQGVINSISETWVRSLRDRSELIIK